VSESSTTAVNTVYKIASLGRSRNVRMATEGLPKLASRRGSWENENEEEVALSSTDLSGYAAQMVFKRHLRSDSARREDSQMYAASIQTTDIKKSTIVIVGSKLAIISCLYSLLLEILSGVQLIHPLLCAMTMISSSFFFVMGSNLRRRGR
jgi:hypothetical protein